MIGENPYPKVAELIRRLNADPHSALFGMHAGSLAQELVMATIHSDANLKAEIERVIRTPPVFEVRLDGDDWPERLGAALGQADRRAQILGFATLDVITPREPRTADMAAIVDAEIASK